MCVSVCVCVVEQSYLERECLHPILDPAANSTVNDVLYVMCKLNEAKLIAFKLFWTNEIHLSDLFIEWVRILGCHYCCNCCCWYCYSKSSKREGKQNQIKSYGCNHNFLWFKRKMNKKTFTVDKSITWLKAHKIQAATL